MTGLRTAIACAALVALGIGIAALVVLSRPEPGEETVTSPQHPALHRLRPVRAGRAPDRSEADRLREAIHPFASDGTMRKHGYTPAREVEVPPETALPAPALP